MAIVCCVTNFGKAITPQSCFLLKNGCNIFVFILGNVLLASLTMADMIIVVLVIPTIAIVILSQTHHTCYFPWFCIAVSVTVSVLTRLSIAAENQARINDHPTLSTKAYCSIVTIVWITGATLVSIQFILPLGFDICLDAHPAFHLYQLLTGGLFLLMPIIITLLIYISAFFFCLRKNLQNSAEHKHNLQILRANCINFLFFILCWLPFCADLTGRRWVLVDGVLWLGLSNCCLSALVYLGASADFRCSYSRLFQYCCCKMSTTVIRSGDRGEQTRQSSEVRVHIIPGYNMYNSANAEQYRSSHNYRKSVCEL